jgi:hypothetical protein
MDQITEYDRRLSQQDVEKRAGFVLSMRDMATSMPDGLQASWSCLTWTQLGRVIEPLLVDDTLSATEAFLARHLLGFIRKHLWEATMDTQDTDTRLDFDDIALIRAFNLIGKQTTHRVDSLVAPLAQVMAAADLAAGSPAIGGKILQGGNRKVVSQSLLDPTNQKPPYLCAGLTSERGLHVTVWLETSPKYAQKQALHHMLKGRLHMLQQRNSAWRVVPLDEMHYWDLELTAPVESLLVAEDQGAWMKDFVVKALDDLKVTGVIENVRRIALGAE